MHIAKFIFLAIFPINLQKILGLFIMITHFLLSMLAQQVTKSWLMKYKSWIYIIHLMENEQIIPIYPLQIHTLYLSAIYETRYYLYIGR